jgi:hypothetical protein
MLPIFVGFAVWIVVCTIILLSIFLVSRRLRRFSGFVFLTPVFGVAGALLGFLAVEWFFNGRARPEIAMTLAFYLGFLLCGGVGSTLGLAAGFALWKRLRRQTE